MMKIDLSQMDESAMYRFLDAETGRHIEVEDIVAVLDTETGHYSGMKCRDRVPCFDDDGRPVVVHGTMGGPVLIHQIGEER